MADQGSSHTPTRTWVVPVDDSPASQRALIWTLETLFKEGDMVHLVHVTPEVEFEVMSPFSIYPAGGEEHAKQVAKARTLLSPLAGLFSTVASY
ncbi:hypothetical protein WJX72_003637 [[Myrmecia] bisecta]|uniref:UspA domain-containing protein n=1 Tax=[Myrmecia] bisecta TaxID=41462 RepID=A0AAW1R4Z8_9CHLO